MNYPKPTTESHACPDCTQQHLNPQDKQQLHLHFVVCFACDEKLYYEYLVKDAVWKDEAGLDYEAGVLHLPCLEKILGRELVLDDFREAIEGPMHFPYANGNSMNDAIRWAAKRFGGIIA